MNVLIFLENVCPFYALLFQVIIHTSKFSVVLYAKKVPCNEVLYLMPVYLYRK